MINNSFLLPVQGDYIKDGQAIVVTTEDEGLWFSLDYGETWHNIDLGVNFSQAVIAREASYSLNRDAIIYASAGSDLYQYRIKNGEVTITTFDAQIKILAQNYAGECYIVTGGASSVNYVYLMYSQTPDPITSSDFGNGIITQINYLEPLVGGGYNIGESAYYTGNPAYYVNKGIRLNGIQIDYPALVNEWPSHAYFGYDTILLGDEVAYIVSNNQWVPNSTSIRFDISMQGPAPDYEFLARFSYGHSSVTGLTVLVFGYQTGVGKSVIRIDDNDLSGIQTVLVSDNIRDVSMSYDAQVQTISVYNNGLLVSNNNGVSFATKLAGKKIISARVLRVVNNRIKKPTL